MPDSIAVHVWILAAYALLAHAVILLSDGLLWDGWLVDSWQRHRDWPLMKRFYREVGLSPLYYQHKAMGALPARVFAYRLVAFLSTLLSAIAVYLLCRISGSLGGFESLLIALLYLSYTGYHMNIDTVVGLQYTLPTALFYWAAFAALVSIDHAGMAHWALRAAALILFFASFNANSTLVYYFGFLGFLFTRSWDPGADIWTSLSREAIAQPDYLVLPFLYWVLKNSLTPRHGSYARYNRIQLHLPMLCLKLFNAVRFGFEAALTAPVRSAAANRCLWIPAAAAVLAYWISGYALGELQPNPAVAAGTLLAAGSALFLLAAIPYALVGQSFFPEGWGTKHHMLFHLPVAMIVLGAFALFLPPDVQFAAIAFLLVANAMHLNLVYLQHIAVTLKNRSWLAKLSKMEQAKGISVFLVTDRHSFRGDPCYPEQEHRPAYLFYMFRFLWGDKTRIGIPVDENFAGPLPTERVTQAIVDSTFDYEMQEIDISGAQARLVISDGIEHSPVKLALKYLRHRYLPGGDAGKILAHVAELQFSALPAPATQR